ncbi:MAG: hypothetical protein H0Z38_00845 [Firmicutes bacterium]|nr:hypothetical protein [Bacillota bacterium]
MDIRAYQQWVKEFDQERGWDLCPGTDTMVHVLEELGEVARCLLALHGYRSTDSAHREEFKKELGEELADAVTFLVKLAYTYDIDLASYLEANQAKCEARFGAGTGSYQTERYLKGLAESSQAMLSEYHARFGKKE